MRKPLTDMLIRSIPKPEVGRTEVTDTVCRGLTVRVSANGERSWSFRFRDPVSGRVTRQTFDGELSLKEVRQKANRSRLEVAAGVNPVEEKRRARQEAQTRTFDALAARYMEEHARRHKRTADADDRALKLHVLPKWTGRRYDKIGRADVIELCEGIVSAGSPTQANRVQALVSKVFSFALDADLITSHPSARLKKRSKETKGTRTLTDPELRLFWSAIGQSPNSERIGLALKLVLLTGARVTEAAGARIAEFERMDDSASATWTIPASRSKNGRVHVVPLSDMAREGANALIELAQQRSKGKPAVYLLASPSGLDEPIDGHALSVAMTRFGGTMAKRGDGKQVAAASSWLADRPTAHDLRRTMATRMSAAGVAAEDVSACLNHARRGVTAQHYDHYDRAREKRRSFGLWAGLVRGIVEEQDGSNVVQLRAAS